MKIAFRADASLQMGSGHVMRCLTLADALKAKGADCNFISRTHLGHLSEYIRQRGFKVNCLEAPVKQAQEPIKNCAAEVLNAPPNHQPEPGHAAWLGSTWQTDATDTAAVLAHLQPDWLVVDHYSLDQRWEKSVAHHHEKLMVIDDLADRAHDCDLLLDQNLGRQPEDYGRWVPSRCQVLTGPQHALLRPEFAALRPYSLRRRQAQVGIGRLLITMGGVDQDNATGQVLQALKTCALPVHCRITVVMGLTAPWLQNVRQLATQLPWVTEVVVNVANMAQRMADSDLAIGAAGSTSWERCCLGLPTLMVVLANNQLPAAQALQTVNAARLIGSVSAISTKLCFAIHQLTDSQSLMRMSQASSMVTEGIGVEQILAATELLNA